MNDHSLNTNIDANPNKRDLLRKLDDETGTARRQDLLKAIWRLDRQATESASPVSARPQVAAIETPEPPTRHPRSVKESNGRPKAHKNTAFENVASQNTPNNSSGIMNEKQTLAVLNHLYAIERFSLANYLRYANPWVSVGDECLDEAIRHIADQQVELSERVGLSIIERRGQVEGGSFPSGFTAYNDLSVAYLVPRVMEDQARIVREVGEVVRQLRTDPAYGLANEILGAEQAHLENLRALLDGQKRESCGKPTVATQSERCRQADAHSVATAA
jgi:hypothetical protein